MFAHNIEIKAQDESSAVNHEKILILSFLVTLTGAILGATGGGPAPLVRRAPTWTWTCGGEAQDENQSVNETPPREQRPIW